MPNILGNIPKPRTTGRDVGSMALQAYQIEQAAQEQQRRARERDAAAKREDERFKAAQALERLRLKTLAKIEQDAKRKAAEKGKDLRKALGGKGGSAGARGVSAPAPGQLPPIPPLPSASPAGAPRHDLVFQGGELQQVAQQGSQLLPAHMLPQQSIAKMREDMELRSQLRDDPDIPQLPAGQGSANFGQFQPPPVPGAGSGAGVPGPAGVPGVPITAASIARSPAEARDRALGGHAFNAVAGGLPAVDAQAAERAQGLIGQATAAGAEQSRFGAELAGRDDALQESLQRSRLPDVRILPPVPGAGVGSQTIGTRGRVLSGKPLSPTEEAASRRAGGLVFEGAPIATDFTRPQARPAPTRPAAKGDSRFRHISNLEAQRDRFSDKWGADDKGVAAIQKRIDTAKAAALGKVNMEFEKGVTKHKTAMTKAGTRPKTDADLDSHVKARAHLYDTYTKALNNAPPSMHDALKKQYQQWVGTLGDAPLPPKAGLSPEATAIIRERMGDGATENVQEAIAPIMTALYARVYNAKDAKTQRAASRDYETFKSQVKGLEGPDAMEKWINIMLAQEMERQAKKAEEAARAANKAKK